MTKEPKNELTGLDLLRKKFELHQISKLPKQDKWMTERKDEYTRCGVCGGWHHPKAIHLDYVGHAALTDRLLDCDPHWNWRPLAVTPTGAPSFDNFGGLWIELTVCGVSRIGYGHPDGKSGGDAYKETIGDALRNAAMRFGAALDLWHKGDLHALQDDDEVASDKQKPAKKDPAPAPKKYASDAHCESMIKALQMSETIEELQSNIDLIRAEWKTIPRGWQDKIAEERKNMEKTLCLK